MAWYNPFAPSSSHHRPGYARSYAGSNYSSRSRHGYSSSSYYKRRPRDGYIQYLLYRLKRFLRELYYYARRHPYKVFFMVVMPLVSSGVLYKVARQFNIPLPDFLKGNAGAAGGLRGAGSYGGAGGSRSGGGYYGSQGYGGGSGGGYGDRYGYERGGSGNGMNIQSVANGIGSVASLAKMAQSFM